MSDPMGTAVTTVESVELGVVSASSPKALVERATAAAHALADVITDRQLYSNIQGKKFVRAEGWLTLAAMMGVTPHEIGVTENEGAFTATVELRRITDGQPIARASAECGPDEASWKSRARYARRSMALTRATSKACRLAFSWVMALTGYEVTPAEEVPGEETIQDGVERINRKAVRGTPSGKASEPKEPLRQPPTDFSQKPAALTDEPDPLSAKERLMPVGQNKGAKLGVLSSKILLDARAHFKTKGIHLEYIPWLDEILLEREGL